MSQDPTRDISKAVANAVIKKVVKTGFKAFFMIAKATAPMWVPVLIFLIIAYSAYMILYGIPRQAIEDNIGGRSLIAAFFGTPEDEEIVETNAHLFEEYKEIAATWAEGLTDNQQDQASAHKFPWSVLIATDRVVNDAAVWGESENIEINPEEVFEALRPRFQFKDSTVTTVTVTSWYEEPDEEGEGGGCQSDTTTTIEEVSLITRADTIEGTFIYNYEWQTDISEHGDECGGSTTVTREVLSGTESPSEYFVPWKEYLALRGIEQEIDKELVQELAMLYDEEYRFNHSLLSSLDYSNYPQLEGSNGWLWPTHSTRITSPYGPRSYPYAGFHQGVDVGAIQRGYDGDPIWSIDDGVVSFSGWAGGFGNLVIVDHGGGVHSLYAHLRNRRVSAGSQIFKGSLLGIMGTTGFSTGTHLHFEIRVNETPLDPKYYFVF